MMSPMKRRIIMNDENKYGTVVYEIDRTKVKSERDIVYEEIPPEELHRMNERMVQRAKVPQYKNRQVKKIMEGILNEPPPEDKQSLKSIIAEEELEMIKRILIRYGVKEEDICH